MRSLYEEKFILSLQPWMSKVTSYIYIRVSELEIHFLKTNSQWTSIFHKKMWLKYGLMYQELLFVKGQGVWRLFPSFALEDLQRVFIFMEISQMFLRSPQWAYPLWLFTKYNTLDTKTYHCFIFPPTYIGLFKIYIFYL